MFVKEYMISTIARNNLKKDKNVLGKKWLKTYNNYFSDKDNIQRFIEVIKPLLADKELDILYVASASGLLGEELVKSLKRGRLTIVDISKKHLEENKNKKTKKVCFDLLKMDLDKKFDLIIMRSSLDYFPSQKLQVSVLKNIKKHLKKDGIFINQPAYISNLDERHQMSDIYNKTRKIGNRHFQSSDLHVLYEKAGFSNFKKIGEGKALRLTEKEHVERYEIDERDIKKIQNIIGEDCTSMKITKSGYKLNFRFPIFFAN